MTFEEKLDRNVKYNITNQASAELLCLKEIWNMSESVRLANLQLSPFKEWLLNQARPALTKTNEPNPGEVELDGTNWDQITQANSNGKHIEKELLLPTNKETIFEEK